MLENIFRKRSISLSDFGRFQSMHIFFGSAVYFFSKSEAPEVALLKTGVNFRALGRARSERA